MRVLLLRHGATEGNEQRRYVGRRTDDPLSPKGRRQCLRAGVCESVAKVYASPMLRARQTAKLCFPHARVVPVDGLQEFDFGEFEGRTADDMTDDAAYRAWVEGYCMGLCPGGESLDDFVWRTKKALTTVFHVACEQSEKLVVIVAHGGTIMAALDGFYDKSVGNCEGFVADVCLMDESFELQGPMRFASLAHCSELLRR